MPTQNPINLKMTKTELSTFLKVLLLEAPLSSLIPDTKFRSTFHLGFRKLTYSFLLFPKITLLISLWINTRIIE